MSEAGGIRGDFLAQMAAASRVRVRTARARVSEAELRARAHGLPRPPCLAVARGGFELIAELKLRSPAAGRLREPSEDVAARVTMYARAGAAAVSVLTEPERFDGSLEHLELAAASLRKVQVPAMRKDFLVDPYQVLEARVAGASGILLIVRMLAAAELDELTDCAFEQGLFVLMEAFDEVDIERLHRLVAARSGQLAAAANGSRLLVGLNCRDLATLEVVPGRLEQLASSLPASVPRVAESGLATARDAGGIAAAGYDLALVGSALMSAADPAQLMRDMLSAGREARTREHRS